MGVINKSDLTDIIKEMNTEYDIAYSKAFKNAETYLGSLMAERKIKSNTYKRVWLLAIPQMRKALGKRVVQNLEVEAIATESSDYELTIGIPRAEVMGENWGLYTDGIAGLGIRAAQSPDKRATQLLVDGKTIDTFDGKFFATNHSLNPDADQSNLLTGTALTSDNLKTAYTTMMKFKDNQGNNLGVKPKTVIVSPDNAWTIQEILNRVDTSDGTTTVTNDLRGKLDYIIDQDLEGSTWYLAGDLMGLKPFEHATFIEPNLINMTDPKDPSVYTKFEYEYSVDMNDSVTFGLWPQLIRCES